MASKWFSVKTLYRWDTVDKPQGPDRFYDPDATLLEERVVLIKANSFSEATQKAKQEAQDYVRSPGGFINPYGQNMKISFLNCYDCFELFDNPADKVEVFSTIRILSRKIHNAKIKNIFICPTREPHYLQSKRKKFINKDFNQGSASALKRDDYA